MLLNLPIFRSRDARMLFFGTAAIIVAIELWANALSKPGAGGGLTPIFLKLFSVGDYAGANCALVILCAAALVSERFSFRPLLRWIGEHPGPVAAASTVALSAGALLVYHDHPLSMDEFSVVFQSQVFASGHLTGQFPLPLIDWLVPRLFQNLFLDVSHATGQVASSYWPSFALLLAPFTALGIPWVCNPLISGLTLLTAHRLALRIFGDVEAAGLTILLTVASPIFFADGISYYTMSAHLLANTTYALLLIQPTPRRAFAAGLVGSVALTLHNPVPHMLFAVPWLFWVARSRTGAVTLAALLAGYLPLVLLLGFGWFEFASQLTHQDTLTTGTEAAADSLVQMGAAFDVPSMTVLLARAIGVAKTWVWAVPGLLWLACVGGWQWRRNPLCRLLIASATITLLGYIIVPFDQGHGWGYRYFHSAWIVLPVLAAGALTRGAPGDTHAKESHGNAVFEDTAPLTLIVACALLTLTLGVGLRAVQMHEFISEALSQEPAYAGTERRVVIIDPTGSFYGQDLVRNDPWLRGNVIRMITHGREADADMMRAQFPELHQVWAGRFGTVWSAAAARVTGNSP
jgi:hypothetical protein